jgi:hypothetical protein
MAQWPGNASENDFGRIVRPDYTIPTASLMQVSPFDEYLIFDAIALTIDQVWHQPDQWLTYRFGE